MTDEELKAHIVKVIEDQFRKYLAPRHIPGLNLEAERLVDKKEVCERTTFSYGSICKLEEKGDFPARRVLGPRRVAWLNSEIVTWMQTWKHEKEKEEALVYLRSGGKIPKVQREP